MEQGTGTVLLHSVWDFLPVLPLKRSNSAPLSPALFRLRPVLSISQAQALLTPTHRAACPHAELPLPGGCEHRVPAGTPRLACHRWRALGALAGGGNRSLLPALLCHTLNCRRDLTRKLFQCNVNTSLTCCLFSGIVQSFGVGVTHISVMYQILV